MPRWAPIAPPCRRWRRALRRPPGTTNWCRYPCPSSSWNRRCSTPRTRCSRSHCRHNTLVSRDSDGIYIRIGVLSRSHLFWGPTRLTFCTPGHCPYTSGQGLFTASPALSTWVLGEAVCITVLPTRSVLERDVIRVDHLDPSRWLSHWVFNPVQPAHGTVIHSHHDLLPLEVTLEVLKGRDHC